MFFPFQFPTWLLASPSTLRSPYCRPLAGVIHTLAYQSLPTEHERPGFRDEIIIRRHRVHDPGEQANPLRAHSGQAVPTDASAGVPLSREVFEQDGVSGAEPPGGPVADHDLHLASGEENGVLAARRIVPIAETAVGRTREGDTAGGLLDRPLHVRWEQIQVLKM